MFPTGNSFPCPCSVWLFYFNINKLTFPRVFLHPACVCLSVCVSVCMCVSCCMRPARIPVPSTLNQYSTPDYRSTRNSSSSAARPCNRSNNQFVHSLWFSLSPAAPSCASFILFVCAIISRHSSGFSLFHSCCHSQSVGYWTVSLSHRLTDCRPIFDPATSDCS